MPIQTWRPDGGTGPGIVVVQEIFGVSEYIQHRCADLAAAGYLVYAPELYWRLPEPPVLNPESDDYIAQGMAAARGLDWAVTVSDVCDAVAALRADAALTDGVGLLGFCLGGGLAFNAAAECRPDALVAYYGSALPGLLGLVPRIHCPSLHHFGTADAYIPLETVELIRTAVEGGPAPVEFELYDGAGHAFDNPIPMVHHADASRRSWGITLDFFATHLADRP